MPDPYRTAKIERAEKQRKINWQHFSMTRRGRMSWANWFKKGSSDGQ